MLSPNRLYASGSKLKDHCGFLCLLHSIGNGTMQITRIEYGIPLYQFSTVSTDGLFIDRDMPSESKTRTEILQFSFVEDEQTQNLINIEKEKECIANEIRIDIRDFSGALMCSIKPPKFEDEDIKQSEVVQDFSSLLGAIMKSFTEIYNDMRDRKKFFETLLTGFESLQSHILRMMIEPDLLYPNVTARFYMEPDGEIRLVISDEKEDVLQYEGHLERNDTVLTTRAMKYVIIPKLKDTLLSDD